MKKILVGFLVLTFSMATFADCTNAYTKKAWHRAVVNKTATIVGVFGAGLATAGVGFLGLSVLGGLAYIAAPVVIAAPIAIAEDSANNTKLKMSNTYFKSLASIEGAKKDILPLILLDKLNKKTNLYSLSDEQQIVVRKEISEIIKNGNESQDLCLENNKVKVLNFRKFVKYVHSNMSLNY